MNLAGASWEVVRVNVVSRDGVRSEPRLIVRCGGGEWRVLPESLHKAVLELTRCLNRTGTCTVWIGLAAMAECYNGSCSVKTDCGMEKVAIDKLVARLREIMSRM